jgi:O-antigen ligase
VIAACAAMRSWQLGSRREAQRYLVLVALFAAAVITPISRGGWLTAVIALVLAAVILRRIRATLLVLVIVGAAMAVIPPFSYSITSALSRTDSSVIGHQQAIDEGAQTVADNPVGLGLGQADHFGQALAEGTGASAGVGENIYLALLVSVGPLGFLMFAAWVLGMIQPMIGSRDPTIGWIAVAVGCSLVGYLAGGLLASPLMRFTTSSTVWLIIGMTIGALSAVSAKEAEPRAPASDVSVPVEAIG